MFNIPLSYCWAVVVVVVVVLLLLIMCIFLRHYEFTSYNLVLCLNMSQCCDNDNHDLPQHVIGTAKWRDDVDGNKCRTIFISIIPVTDTVSMCTCHCILFPFLLLYADKFWIPQYIDVQNKHFYCWCKPHFWQYIFDLANQTEISNPIYYTHKNIWEFSCFSWCHQTIAEIVPWKFSVPLLSMSFPSHHPLSSR